MDFSMLASTFSTLRTSTALSTSLQPTSRLVLLEARTLADVHVPPYPPELPALLMGVDSGELAMQLRGMLLAVYPKKQKVFVVDGGKAKEESLGEFGEGDFSGSTCIYVPALEEGTAFESFTEIVAHLRAPDGCPWDREQTHATLRKHLLEESYEALEAIDSGDFISMREEFGDLLLQIVLHAQIAGETGHFTMTDVVKGIHDKILRRHPHVFGDLQLDGVDGVLANWERLKEKERGKKKEEKGLLDGVPLILPALNQAQEYQDRAARVGFDWPEIEGVLDKVREEIEEIKQAENQEQIAAELGDLFFVLVNLARWKKVDAESALRGTNLKFKKRFSYVEQGAKRQGRSLSDMTLEEMDAFWNEAKTKGM
jgi:tetrapyrrole methylase family protein/MazG family protein